MELIIGTVVAGILIPLWFWIDGKISQVRTAVRAAEPTVTCTIGSYGGAGYGIHANVHNVGQVQAHDLRLSLPTLDPIWQQATLNPGSSIRPQVPIPDNSPLFTAALGDIFAILAFKDRFGLDYALNVNLEQIRVDSGRFNLRGVQSQLERPVLTKRRLWTLRNEV